MDYSLSEEQKMLQSSVREMASLEVSPRAGDMDSYHLFPWEGIKALAQAELMGMLLPPPYGGTGADYLSFVLVTEEVARACPNTALVYVTHMASSFAILVGGQEGFKREWLPQLARGDKLAAFAATEADSGANVLATKTTAARLGDGYQVNGNKIYITSADEADLYLTAVLTSPQPGPAGLSLLAIEKGIPGYSLGRKFVRMGFNGTSNGELFFANCQVPADHLIGPEGGYMGIAMPLVGVGMLGAGATALGIAQAALESCLTHAKQRVVAGQPLGGYQGVQFLVSEISALVEAGRGLLYTAARTHQTAPPGVPVHALQAKLFASEMAVRVTDMALQLHGGAGYTNEYSVERLYRDARGLTLHFGVTEPLKELLGRALLGLLPG